MNLLVYVVIIQGEPNPRRYAAPSLLAVTNHLEASGVGRKVTYILVENRVPVTLLDSVGHRYPLRHLHAPTNGHGETP